MTTTSIPIVQLKGCLLLSIQVELSDTLVAQLRDDITARIQATDVTGLVIELSGVDILDSFIVHSIGGIAQSARLMGVKTVLAGLDPDMAITLVEMGLTLQGVATALSLDAALDSLAERERQATSDPALLLLNGGQELDASLEDEVLALLAGKS